MRCTSVLSHLIAGVCIACQSSIADEPKSSDSVAKIVITDGMGELEDAIGKLQAAVTAVFPSASDDRVRELTASPNDSVALHAAWEEVRRTVAGRPIAGQKRGMPAEFNPREMQHFLGFVEGRLRLTLPDWWEARLEKATTYPPQAVIVLTPDGEVDTPFVEIAKGLKTHKNYSVKIQENGDLNLGIDNLSCRIPAHFVIDAKKRHGADVFLTAWMDRERCIFCLHSRFQGGSSLYCINATSSSLLWSNSLSNFFGGGGGSGGGHFHLTEMRRSGNTIYVFGVLNMLAYVEAFAVADGKPAARFSTYSWAPLLDAE